VKFDRPYCLSIQVGNEPELSPRMALTSVGYSFSSLRADTARVAMATSADTTWRHKGLDIYKLNGNVGIGRVSSSRKLHVVGGNMQIENLPGQPTVLTIGNDSTGSTYLGITTSAYGSGYIGLQGVSKEGSAWGHIALNPRGGGVGIGLTNPIVPLALAVTNKTGAESPLIIGQIDVYPMAGVHHVREDDYHGYSALTFKTTTGGTYTEKMRITYDGRVGIGTTNPVSKFAIGVSNGNGDESDMIVAQIANSRMAGIHHVREDNYISYSSLSFKTVSRSDYTEKMRIRYDGNVGIGTTNPTTKLHVEGTTTTKVLAITGGSDLAEPFEISESQSIPKGALVIIDEENPGRLKLSHQAYDKRVAGVVSGAGGINPGLTLTQEGVLAGGQNVALSGRVYALATAANGSIKPGDLLTASDIPGHAMKATDRERWDGAIIGKAMSGLENGEGLVLVLVNLQ